MFNPGDLVIKNTGGNKMKIISFDTKGIICAWFSDRYNEMTFNEKDLIPFSQYKNVLISEQRDDLINKIVYN
jgi:uncharacterized protein YodC (DUF2158 family)